MPFKKKKRFNVRVWRASPSTLDLAQWRALTGALSLSERSKAFSFKFEADRQAYVLAHGLRRFALAFMLDVSPQSLVFRDDENGRPQLIKPNHSPIYFSHSHTRESVLFAASCDAAIGVDTERVVAELADMKLLQPYWVMPELAEIEAASFYNYWTALEAFWKADGTGLSGSHPRLRMSAHPLGHWDVACDVPRWPDLTVQDKHAVIFSVTSSPGCVASLAIIQSHESDVTNFVIHEKELKKDTDLMGQFFKTTSATRSALGAQR